MFTENDIIYAYTRKEAIEDGQQLELSKDITKEAGFKYPVFITETIVNIINSAIANKKYCCDFNGIVWDILNVLRVAIKKSSSDDSTIRFNVSIAGKIFCYIHKSVHMILIIQNRQLQL